MKFRVAAVSSGEYLSNNGTLWEGNPFETDSREAASSIAATYSGILETQLTVVSVEEEE